MTAIWMSRPAPEATALPFVLSRSPRPQPARPLITDHRRIYSDAEFGLILRKAAELANPEERPGQSSDGLTLAEMKAAASEAGIDPALVERAARLLPASASSSLVERLMGGPLRHGSEIHVPVRLDEATAARLLAAVQISAGHPGSGQSSSIGMVWHSRDEWEPLSVTAQSEEGGASVAVHLDHRGTMASILVSSLIGFLGAGTAGMVLGEQVAPALGAAAAVSGMGGIVALARGYWAYSTKRVRERISGVTDAVGQVIAQSEGPPPASPAIGDSSGSGPAAPQP